MSKPASRGKPLATPPRPGNVTERKRPVVDDRPRGARTPGVVSISRLVAPVDMIVDQSADSRLWADVMAWKSPVKCRLMSSIGTTWA